LTPAGSIKDKEKAWSKRIFEDLPRKTLFLFLVCLLWASVIGIRRGEVSFNIPIEYYSMPQNLVIVGEPPREVNVRLKGSQRLLSSIKPDQIRARVDLSKTHKGLNQISLSETNINIGPGISVTNFYPRGIRLQLSQISNTDKSK
jgi:hypothetical protein